MFMNLIFLASIVSMAYASRTSGVNHMRHYTEDQYTDKDGNNANTDGDTIDDDSTDWNNDAPGGNWQTDGNKQNSNGTFFIQRQGQTSYSNSKASISGSGRATYYGGTTRDPSPSRSTPGACGLSYLPPSDHFVAMNYAQFDPYNPNGNQNNNVLCGLCAYISCAGGGCVAGSSTKAYLTDRCPTCPSGALDISKAAFKDLVGGKEDTMVGLGVIQINWYLGTC